MRILHVVPSYIPAYRYGGPIESVHALNKHLLKKGAEVTVYTTAMNGDEDLDVPTNTPVIRDGVVINYFKPSFPRAWFYSSDLHSALKANIHKFDIVHITSVFLAASTLAARAAKAAGKPYIISPRGSLMTAPLTKKSAFKKRAYLSLVEKSNLAEAAAIHFTAEVEKQEYLEAQLPMRQGLVISNGLDTSSLPAGDPKAFRKKFNIKDKEKVVLFLSRISWKKGLDTLIDAFAGLLKDMPNAVLVIAGGDDESYRGEVESSIFGHGITNRTVFTGPLEGTERSAAYQAADVFALPSYAENFGVVVAEAMHFELPVVITEAVGIAPWVKQADAGFVIEKDVLQLKFALYKILSNPSLGRKMGERGKRLVAEEFSYDAVADQFMEAYSRLILK